MKDILYVAYYDYENYHDCISISSQLSAQNNIGVLHIFSDLQIRNTYHQYCCVKNKNYIKYIDNKFQKLSSIISEYKNSYRNFCFLKTTKIIFNEQYLIKNNSTNIIYLDNVGCVFSLNNIIDFDRKSLLYANIFDDININNYYVLQKTQNIINVEKISKIESKEIFNSNHHIFYEDNNCLFAIFEEKIPNLLKSPAYFNKNNNKIYSVSNNCLGNVIEYTTGIISIEWLIGEDKIVLSYQKNADHLFV